MHSIATIVTALCLATSALATYDYGDSSSGSSSSSSTDASGSENGFGPSDQVPAVAVLSASGTAEAATPTGMVKIHVVKVSNNNGELKFEPNNLKAEPGHMVQFHFWPRNHSVVQSTFDQPCVPINQVNSSIAGFYSGFQPVQAASTDRPVFTIPINDTKPIWYYCSQGKHCQGGMVGVINPPAQNKSRTIETFAELAELAPDNISPPQGAVSGGSGDNVAPSGTVETAPAGTNTAAVAAFTGAANAFASRQGILASVGMTGVLGFFVAFL